MKTKISRKLLSLLLLVMSVVMTGCNYTDAVSAYDGLDLDKLLSTTYEFSGFVFDNLGATIKNARLTAYAYIDGEYEAKSSDATTEAGVYKLSVDKNDKISDIKIKVDADGYYSDSVTYEMPMDDKIVSHNFHLFVNPDSGKVTPGTLPDYLSSDRMTEDRDGFFQGYLTTQTVRTDIDNTRGHVKIELQLDNKDVYKLIQPNGGEDTTVITMTAMYTESQVRTYEKKFGRSVTFPEETINDDDSLMMCGVYLASNIMGGQLEASKTYITYNVDADMANSCIPMKFRQGAWHKLDLLTEATIDKQPSGYYIDGSKIVVRPDDFGAYALFMRVTRDENPNPVNTDSIYLKWDNPNTFPITIQEGQYLYKMGVSYDRNVGGTVGNALLLERLYRTYGYKLVDLTGVYKMNDYVLKPQYRVVLRGNQDFDECTFTAGPAGQCGQVTMKSYGSISWTIISYTRHHNGSDLF